MKTYHCSENLLDMVQGIGITKDKILSAFEGALDKIKTHSQEDTRIYLGRILKDQSSDKSEYLLYYCMDNRLLGEVAKEVKIAMGYASCELDQDGTFKIVELASLQRCSISIIFKSDGKASYFSSNGELVETDESTIAVKKDSYVFTIFEDYMGESHSEKSNLSIVQHGERQEERSGISDEQKKQFSSNVTNVEENNDNAVMFEMGKK